MTDRREIKKKRRDRVDDGEMGDCVGVRRDTGELVSLVGSA